MMFLLQRYNVELYKKFVKFDEAKNQHSRVTRSVVVGALASCSFEFVCLDFQFIIIIIIIIIIIVTSHKYFTSERQEFIVERENCSNCFRRYG
jgi:hypothetical protein